MVEKHTCWFIDLENVGTTRFRSCYSKFGKSDSVFIVYSAVCKYGAENCYKELERMSIDVHMIFSPLSGDNALDFVLVAELSRRSVENPSDEYFIVSVDYGFDSVAAYLRKNGVSVRRVSPASVGVDSRLSRKPLTDVQRHVLYDYIVTNGLKLKGGERYQYLNEICQRYSRSTRKANLVYQSLKPILDDRDELLERKLELGFSW